MESVKANCNEPTISDLAKSKYQQTSSRRKDSEPKFMKQQTVHKSQAQIFQSAVISGAQNVLSPKPKNKRKGNPNLNKACIQSNPVTSGESSFVQPNQGQSSNQKPQPAQVPQTLFNKIQQ